MLSIHRVSLSLLALVALLLSITVTSGSTTSPVPAATSLPDSLFFSTNAPDGKMAMAGRPASGGGPQEIEPADDFIVAPLSGVFITRATFRGLLPQGQPFSNVQQVVVEIYRVFPKDSDTVRVSQVPTRTNSPSDVAFESRDSASNELTFTVTSLNPSFNAANSVLNGIFPAPNQKTGGDGPVTGNEVEFSVTFSPTISLPPDHYFFVPQVLLASGDFFWLSAPRPIVAPGTPINPDLQAWIRNAALDPDWLRVGTDIVDGNPAPTFNGSFALYTSYQVYLPLIFKNGTISEVSIVDFAFNPPTITIGVGETVTWTNNGSVRHTVTSDQLLWDSGQLNPGDTFQHTFDQPGTFSYHCTNHPLLMKGTVIVQ